MTAPLRGPSPGLRTHSLLLSLVLLCSCATEPAIHSRRPADVSINADAGQGNHLYVMLRLQSGEELPFIVDTGSPITLFDKTLEPKLGDRLGPAHISRWGVKVESGVYTTPTLYLGNTPLMITSTNIASSELRDLSSISNRPQMGILGMDCLENYCLQLDFKAGKMRFLDSAHLNMAKLGKAYPLTFSREGQEGDFFRPFIHHAGLGGGNGANLLVDTGLSIDGALKPGLFRQVREQRLRAEGSAASEPGREYEPMPECVWDGETYTNLLVQEAATVVAGAGANILGLRFLARQLVTFDFPRRTMYLRQQSVGPLANDTYAKNALMDSLAMVDGKLPRNLEARLNEYVGPAGGFFRFSATVNLKKTDDPTTLHYSLARKLFQHHWALKKAWRTDQNGHTIAEYPVP